MTDQGTRSAGVLMHISSLDSPFGIGDLGPGAYAFADLLHLGHQRYWQILPLNPVQEKQQYSPYSSISGMAGNTLLISPELLAKEGLLTPGELETSIFSNTGEALFEKASAAKAKLFEKAYQRFVEGSQQAFEEFMYREAFWLDDFALYVVLKEHFGQQPWFAWPEAFRDRDLATLLNFTSGHDEEIVHVKWLQFIFFRQWQALKAYCNDKGIRILGDLPFYVSHDSVDVWANPELFHLNADGSMQKVAGVPPDYFNENGQLWGMPVYRWREMKARRFDWWLKRIRKNLELFDEVRLDHFRAFASYWEVPASEKTAIHGRWKKGPGAALFAVLKQEFGTLPFLAEDLGEISDDVYALRDRFRLPGMKVLQFAFGKEMPCSDHIPHQFTENFFVYTGTHDNNTTRGWYSDELAPEFREQLAAYTGAAVQEKNVHLVLARLAYASVARTVILPMQDLLGVGSEARMNMPASLNGNWRWRLQPPEMIQAVFRRLEHWTFLYNRQ